MLAVRADVPATGITVLSGPSGSGKTTLLRALAGLEPHVTGTVQFAGEDWSNRHASARGVGYVFQDARLFPHLSVADNLDYGAKRRGIPPDKVRTVIDALDLGPLVHRAPATLSGGEARRVALGRALASGPQILLLDEPLTGLDRARKADLMPYIARAVATFGIPALYVTHSPFETATLADRVLSIHNGRLTGWQPAPPRLRAHVAQVDAGRVLLGIGDSTIWITGHGRLNEAWAVPLGESYVISTREPGDSTADLTMPCRLAEVDTEMQEWVLEVAGQRVPVPLVDESSRWTIGQALWLTLPNVTGHITGTEADDIL